MSKPSVDVAARLASSSPSLFPALDDTSPLPITHLNNITTYLSDWKSDRRHARRPHPPTPARMATKSRPVSTAIPGPATGTSRRLTNKSCLLPLLSPEKARRPSTQRRSIGAKTDFPPSPSYHLPRSLLPRSESLLTDFENDQQFKRVFDSPEMSYNRFPGLPKSHTTPALLSPNKDIASHSLLKPIGPPLPRSITYNDVSSAQLFSNSPTRIQSSTVKISFDGVVVQERSDVHTSKVKSPYPQIPDQLLPKSSWRRVSTSKLPPHTTDGAVQDGVKISSNPDKDSRFVYAYELSSYWAGRYVALLDRLRTRRFISPPSSRNAFALGYTPLRKNPKPRETAEFARIEINIEREAMKILRSFCQTDTATESFEQFEYSIRREHVQSLRRSGTVDSCDTVNVDIKEETMLDSQPVAALDESKVERRILSGTFPRRMFRKASSTVQQQPKLPKSVTVGNLCNPQIYIGLNPSSGGSEAAHGPIGTSASAVPSQEPSICRPKTGTFSESNITSPRMPLNTPSADRLNVEASRNFSHRDAKKTVNLVDGGTSLHPVSTKSTEESSSISETMPMESSRRFRKSDSLKQLVDHSIKEMKKMRKRKVTGTTDGGDD